jgi:putative endonuclease
MCSLSQQSSAWSVYIIECSDGTLYTGITTDVKRRFEEHSGTSRGAKYFNAKQPVNILYQEHGHTRSSASKREAQIKALTRAQKQALILTLSTG